jgi:adenosylhomocysteine nucleosidase
MSAVILCGMPDERRVLQNALPGVVVLGGTDKLNLPHLVPVDCAMIVSAGLCGGLAPGLGIGAMVVATTVTDQAGREDQPDWTWNTSVTKAAAAAGIKIAQCPYYSSGVLDEADSAPQRAAIYKKYGAMAIDDESRYVAALAARRRISFGIFRSVSDDWTETLPLAATGAIMNKDGSANIDYLLASLARQPGQVPQLLKIAKDYSTSLDALEAAAKACRAVFSS